MSCYQIRRNLTKKMVVFALTLIRHGETGANKENIIQGQSDVPLSDAGLKQAHLLAQRLQNQKYTHVFASDLSRAKQTAQTILDKNHYSKGPIVQESRLRERKFGEVEGKTFSELKRLARRANQTVPSFTPSGAETVQQVRQRAVLFFQELCQILKTNDRTSTDKTEEPEINGVHVGGMKRRRHSSSNSTVENNGVAVSKISVKRERSELSSSDDEGHLISSAKPAIVLSNKITRGLPVASAFNGHGSELCVYVPSRSSVVRHRRLAEKIPLAPKRDSYFEEPGMKNFSAVLNTVNGDCPNVSLSPRVLPWSPTISEAHRKASVDSSNDDFDASPSIVANVLIVSHGGLLKELIRHFVEDLGCTVPGGKAQALRISPNTGLSKFTVSIIEGDEDDVPKVICLLIHDKDHLMENGFKDGEGNIL